MRGTPLERFWAKVEKTDTCWNWTDAKSPDGYGRIFVQRSKPQLAHRFSYELVNGPVPTGMQVDHTCHNRACVNPAHLRVVTRKQNMENRNGAPAHNTSGVRGVTWNQAAKKWVASVGHGGKRFYAGSHDSLHKAEAAVIAKRLELHTHNDSDRLEESKP